jgi:hypothetical protein
VRDAAGELRGLAETFTHCVDELGRLRRLQGQHDEALAELDALVIVHGPRVTVVQRGAQRSRQRTPDS